MIRIKNKTNETIPDGARIVIVCDGANIPYPPGNKLYAITEKGTDDWGAVWRATAIIDDRTELIHKRGRETTG